MTAPVTERAAVPTVETIRALRALNAFRRDPLGLFASVARLPDGFARTRFLGTDMFFITHPDHVHRVLQENARNYTKNAPMYTNARPFLGNGIAVTEGGEDWMSRRRLMQPVFHHEHVRLVSEVTEHYLVDVLAEHHRLAASGEPVDLALEMTRLAMRIVCRTLFDTEVTDSSADIARRLDDIAAFAIGYLTRPFPPLFVPTRRHRAFHANVRCVKEFISGVVGARLADPGPHGDLLDLLVGMLDGAGGGMTREALHDELLGLFFAGHDTLAQTMSWCWYLLARSPRVDAELCRELDRVLGGRPATLADLPELRYARLVVEEAMRLYPVIWANMRRAVAQDRIGGHRIPAGSVVMWSPYVGNRLPEIWDEPDEFRPERFLPGNAAKRERHAVVPFGEGPRICIGAGFASAETVLILATLAQQHRVRLVSDRPAVPALGFTLYPQGGVWATLGARS